MPNWKKLIVSGSSAELTTLKITGTSGQSSEGTSLMINSSGVVGTRELGSNAFNSNTYNNYSLPLGSSSTRGGFKIGYTESGKNYPVEISSEKMYVNVPWTDNNTTYSVGDGGLSQKNFTTTLKNKLDGIAASATNVTNNNQISNGAGYITSFTNTVDMGDGFKIANEDGEDQFTVTENEEIRFAGSGATGVSFDADTQKITITSTDNNTTYSVGDGGLTQKNFTSTLKSKLDGIAASANNYVLPTNLAGDDINVDTGALTGATVISDLDFNITTNTSGLVTDANGSVATRTLTLANLGYSGATNANYITNNNQLSNGAGYITSFTNTVDMGSGFIVANSGGTSQFTIVEDNALRFAGSGATSVAFNSTTKKVTISSTDTNTTYSVGDGGLSQKNFTTTLKSKLDGIASSATNVTNNNQLTNGAGYITSFTNTVDMGDGFKIANEDGEDQFTVTENEEIRFAGSGATSVAFDDSTQKITISSTDNNTTYSVGDGGLSQKNFTTTLKSKLDGIAASANNYSLPLGSSSTRGGVKIGYSENGKNYPVELSSEKMYVNVPWTDNNTTYSVGDGGLSQKNFTTTLKSKLDGIAASATNVTNNNQISNGAGYITSFTNTVDMGDGFKIANSGGTDQFTVTENEEIRFAGSGATSVSFDSSTQKVTISSTDNNTTYSVGDGGLTQNNFTDADHSKLNGIAASATNVTNNNQLTNGAGYRTSAQVDAAIATVVDSAPSALNTLNELAAALGDDADFAGSVTTSLSGKLSTSGKAADSNLLDGLDLHTGRNNEANKVVRTDGNGYATFGWINTTSGATSGTINRIYCSADGYIRYMTPANFRTSMGIAENANNYSHPTYNGDDFSVDTGALTGATVVSDIDINVTTDGQGHVTDANGSVATRTLTLANLGYSGASNANYITNNNQLTNGAGYITSFTNTVDMGDGFKIANEDGEDQFTVTENEEIRFAGSGATSVAFDDSTQKVTISSTNTTYSVGDGGLTQKNFTTTLKSKLDGIAASANNYSHPTFNGDDFSVDTGALTGATVVSDIDINVTTDGNGHVTDANGSVATRTLTLANLGYTGATNANNFTYSLPAGSSSTRGGFKIGYSESGKNYPVEVSSEKMYVNVPWTDNDTTYSVGDGGLSQKNFTTTLKNKLDGIAASATNVTNNNQLTNGAGYITSYTDTNTVDMGDGFKVVDGDGTTVTITENKYIKFVEGSGIDINFTDTNQGISSDPFDLTITNTITNNNQLTNGAGYITSFTNTVDMGSGFKIANEDGEDQFTVTENEEIRFAGSGATGVSFDAETQKVTISSTNTTYSVGDGGLTQKNFTTTLKSKLDGIASSANNYSHPTYNGDDFSVDTGALTGATIVSDIDINVTTDGQGHVTDANGSVATRTLTLANLGYTGATNANYITNNNQLTNGAGFITSYTDTNTITYIRTGTNSQKSGNIELNGSSDYGMTVTEVASGNYAIRLLDDRRRNSSTSDIKTGNIHDYIFFDASHGQRFYTSGAEEMRLENDGDLHVDGDVIAYSTTVSDERLKDNVTTIENPLDKIKALRGVEYDWNAGSRKGKHDLGLIAQEVEKVLPNIVHEHQMPLLNDDEEDETVYKTVDYEKMVAVLIEGMKEQQNQIDSLKSELTEIKGRL